VKVLLVNPPIYDFTAYDFWLRPYGLLRVGGLLRRHELKAFDYLVSHKRDAFGRGHFEREPISKPSALADVPRNFYRFGRSREEFRQLLSSTRFDVVLVQTVMTYWYLGVREVIQDVRSLQPNARIVLGGVYATLCFRHAESLGADVVISGSDLKPLELPLSDGLPFWEGVDREVATLKITDGCPFRCTYCSVPQVYPKFHGRPLDRSLAELELLARLGVGHVAFYDDALLYRPKKILGPFLREVIRRGIQMNLHTPNAMNARFIDREMAPLLIAAGFKNIYLGFESSAFAWQKKTGGKVYSDELARAVENLFAAGAAPRGLHAYLIVGHPGGDEQAIEDSILLAHSLGIRVMLSEFSPIPGTPDGEQGRRWVDLDEPLWHNKTAFAARRLGAGEINRLKRLVDQLNRRLQDRPANTSGTGAQSPGVDTLPLSPLN